MRAPPPVAAARGFWGRGRPRVGIDPGDRAVEGDRVAGRRQVLGAERASLRERIARAGAERLPPHADVDPFVGGAVAASDEQRSRAVEDEVADRMAGELLAPVLEQDRLGRLPIRPQGEPRDAAAHRAADLERRIGLALEAPVPVLARPAPGRRDAAQRRVVGVPDVDVGPFREGRVDGDREQPALVEGVNLGAEVGDDARPLPRARARREQHAALLGDEHPPVARERDRRRLLEPAKHCAVLVAGRQLGARYGRQRASNARGRDESGGHATPHRADHFRPHPLPHATPERPDRPQSRRPGPCRP